MFRLLHSGNEYFDQLSSLIEGAEETIHILMYTLVKDETGKHIIERLIKASERGVKVSIVADAFGSNELSGKTIKHIQKSGIRFRKFSQYLTGNLYSAGRRMHIKMILIDSGTIIIGGMNISNSYTDIGRKAWRDYAVVMKDEKICTELKEFYEDLYSKKLNSRTYKKYSLKNEYAQVLINDWFHYMPMIDNTIHSMIDNSKEEIDIMISYFLPRRSTMNKLAAAAKRGVKVNLLNSYKWDVPFVGRAIHYLYPWLEKHSINLYEWKPTMLHAKVMIVDRKTCTIGSYNLNGLSRYNSLEMNVNITEKSFVENIQQEFDKLLSDSDQVEKVENYHTNPFNNAINWLSYQVLRMALVMMFFLVKERQNQEVKEEERKEVQ